MCGYHCDEVVNKNDTRKKKPSWTSNMLLSNLSATWWQEKSVPLSLLVPSFLPSDDIFLKDLCRREQILPPWPDETARHPEWLEKFHSTSCTFSIRNCMELSGTLTVQAPCVLYRYRSNTRIFSAMKISNAVKIQFLIIFHLWRCQDFHDYFSLSQ